MSYDTNASYEDGRMCFITWIIIIISMVLFPCLYLCIFLGDVHMCTVTSISKIDQCPFWSYLFWDTEVFVTMDIVNEEMNIIEKKSSWYANYNEYFINETFSCRSVSSTDYLLCDASSVSVCLFRLIWPAAVFLILYLSFWGAVALYFYSLYKFGYFIYPYFCEPVDNKKNQ